MPPVVDLHSHVLPPSLVAAIRADPGRYRMRVEGSGPSERFVRDDGHSTPVHPEFHDVDAKLAAMDRRRIDVSAVSITPVVFFYWLDGAAGAEVARRMNDGIAELVAARPDRLRGMGTLPLQDPDAAGAELERCVTELGFRTVQVGCAIEGRPLADPALRPVLRRAAELGVALFAHPYFSGAVRPELERWYLANLLGHPFSSAVMAAELMFSGALDELPDLEVVLAHGGGHLPAAVGRLAHGHRVRRDTAATGGAGPRDLVRRFHADALTHDDAALRLLLETIGPERVVIGSDDPFDMAEDDPVGRVERLDGLDEAARAAILGGNALRLLGEAPSP